MLSIAFANHLDAKVIDLSSDASVNIKNIFNKVNNTSDPIKGKKWRVGIIEHRKIVKFIPNTVQFHYDEVLSYDTSFSALGIPMSMQLTNGFETGYSISTSESVTVAGETAIGVGAGVPGVKLSASTKKQNSFISILTAEFSSNYSNNLSIPWHFDQTQIQLPSNSSYCIGTVGDYISFEATVYEEEYYWFNITKKVGEELNITVKIIIYNYITAIYSNGDFYPNADRDYQF